MKNGAVVFIAGLALAGIGFAIVKSKTDSGSTTPAGDPRKMEVLQQGAEGGGLWYFVVFAGKSDKTIVHGPDGPYNNMQAALAAGQTWLRANPPV
jgi:hypothetical protein